MECSHKLQLADSWKQSQTREIICRRILYGSVGHLDLQQLKKKKRGQRN